MNEQSKIDDGWDELLGDVNESLSPTGSAATPLPGSPPSDQPAGRTTLLGIPTPSFGRTDPPTTPRKTRLTTDHSSSPTPPEVAPGESTNTYLHIPERIHPSRPDSADPPVFVPPPSTGSVQTSSAAEAFEADEALPPPPEFLPRATSEELPLEHAVGPSTEALESSASASVPLERPLEHSNPFATEDVVGQRLDDPRLDIDSDAHESASIHDALDLSSRAAPEMMTNPSGSANLEVALDLSRRQGLPIALEDQQTRAVSRVKARPGRSTRMGGIPTPAPPSSIGRWIALGGVAAVALVGAWAWSSTTRRPSSTASAMAPPPAALTPLDQRATPKPPERSAPVATETPPASPSPTPPSAPAAVESAVPPPTVAAPTTTDDDPQGPGPSSGANDPPAPSLAPSSTQADYEAAQARYEQTGEPDAVLAMTIASCTMGQGPQARGAFRKLKGKQARTEAIVTCRSHGVDVLAKGPGYTGPELLAQAQQALDRGDLQTAFDKAHASNKAKRSNPALFLKALVSCKLNEPELARRLMQHVARKDRAALIEGCQSEGIELSNR